MKKIYNCVPDCQLIFVSAHAIYHHNLSPWAASRPGRSPRNHPIRTVPSLTSRFPQIHGQCISLISLASLLCSCLCCVPDNGASVCQNVRGCPGVMTWGGTLWQPGYNNASSHRQSRHQGSIFKYVYVFTKGKSHLFFIASGKRHINTRNNKFLLNNEVCDGANIVLVKQNVLLLCIPFCMHKMSVGHCVFDQNNFIEVGQGLWNDQQIKGLLIG